MTGLPWGLSLAAGIAVVVMTLGSQMAIHQSPELTAFPGETETLKAREIAVDILGAPGTSVMADKQGDTDGVGMDQRSPEINYFLAPAKGGGAWTQKADMPTARFYADAAVVDGKIYVFGGTRAGVMWDSLAVVEEYDPATNTWTARADMPITRHAHSVAAVNGIIYVFGGLDFHPNGWRQKVGPVEAYDPTTDKWTKKADMPVSRTQMAAVALDGKIYTFGGLNSLENIIHSIAQVYDPATDTWTRKADMPTARWRPAACVIDGRIYVSGGDREYVPATDGGGSTAPTVEVYDPATDTWTHVSDMPWPRRGHSASVVDGKMYIIGGVDTEMQRLYGAGKLEEEALVEAASIVHVYDPATDTWTTAADCPFPTMNHTANVVDGKIYTIGGSRNTATDDYSIVEEFDPNLSGNIAVASPAGKLLRTWGEVKSE
jgi:N-acetylneuraminic acid mutarotase